MDDRNLKVPPPLVAVSMAVLMWLIARAVPAFAYVVPARYIIASCVSLVGIGVAIAGVIAFRAAGTTVNPLRPEKASALVTSGIYRVTRNPMYLGLLFVLVGWALVLSNVMTLIILPLFVLYMNRFQIRPEEAALASLFGAEFTQYQSRVRRWL